MTVCQEEEAFRSPIFIKFLKTLSTKAGSTDSQIMHSIVME